MGNNIIPGHGIDTNTFHRISDRFIADNQNVFIPSAFIAKKTDFAIVIEPYYFRNATTLYYYPNGGSPQIMPTANVDQFKYLGGSYFRDDNEVFYFGELLAKLDANITVIVDSFEYIAKDTDTLYYEGTEVVGIDVPTFEILNYNFGGINYPSPIYYRDAARVYCQKKQLIMADRNTFVAVFSTPVNGITITASDQNNNYSYCQAYPKPPA